MSLSFDPPRITVFCGSRPGARPAYAAAARALGACLAAHDLGLVYGGGSVGLMGTVADATLAAGGEVIGVIPEALARPEIAHAGLSELHVVDGMHPRKWMMAERAAAFVALPGGVGTLEELFEALSWTQLGIQHKPVGLLDVDGYWRPLCAMLDHAVEEGFVTPEHRSLLVVAEDSETLLSKLAAVPRPRDIPPPGLEV